ncbi:hypothetical protein [Brevibacillus porteri]|uniref:hypothetical protein n=1 Tax=Brevibacillus porteri TaxID=2126350 RepID=UPI002E1A1B14|nr:hypothetical protein [Brevibacillus porteri]MED2131288.1 hypothetical protein [Brevibacillus porteri]MED2892935.1 hypothetical protein [Brevibacillus porteri]
MPSNNFLERITFTTGESVKGSTQRRSNHEHKSRDYWLRFHCKRRANPDRAQKLVAKYGGTVAASWQEVVHHPEVQAISDCSTNEMHHIITTEEKMGLSLF